MSSAITALFFFLFLLPFFPLPYSDRPVCKYRLIRAPYRGIRPIIVWKVSGSPTTRFYSIRGLACRQGSSSQGIGGDWLGIGRCGMGSRRYLHIER